MTWRKTISGKLTSIYALMFVIVLLLLNTAVYLGLNYFVRNNARQNLDRIMNFLSSRILQYNYYNIDLMEELSRSEGNIYFRILSNNRNIRFQSNLLEDVDMPVVPGYQELKIGERIFIYTTRFILDRGIFIGYIQLVREITSEYHFLRFLFLIMLITSFLGIIAAIVTGHTITRKILQPIISITDTAKEISGSDISRRLEITGPEDELTDLARTFNSMLDRLEKAFQGQRQFVSDASHELRTPIAVIQGYANLLDRWGKKEETVRDEAIEAIKKEAENMKLLVESLLFLARGDDEKIIVNKSEFYFNELIEEVIQETLMITDKLKIYDVGLEQLSIVADRELLKQMLRVFVDNSIKYTPPGGELRIGLGRDGNFAVLTVEDTGIGIPEEHLPHIFERFYRVDKARSDKKGAGLGLAIARWIIEKHRGKVEVISSPGNGTRVVVRLPLSMI